MKSIFFKISIVFLTLIFSNTMKAQEEEKVNYAVMTSKIQQLKPITHAAEELQKEDGALFGAFETIIYGKEVVALTDKRLMKPYLKNAKQANISLVVCKMALDLFEVKEKDLPKEFKVVPDAFLYYLQLQKKGYLTLSL
ncbi:DsrE/DsrF/DrsH-like family protein [Arenibacter nanhaiticus]|uniref:DsrE/DsrF/DrsH-like family protein n=1 Tax=Arenibacter nanhaiticus TaxID=558155 RepID=A0A1M6GZZ6_9FLAO|nr:DsrE/DsrF/DrsH-like family protein [Arenibacter nanhaiticus]SHJ15518.1 DsrE/DsrF/DrsH-like family protein [Arenibacter nanhaiticus]